MNRLYDRSIYGMAWLAGALLVAMMVMIVVDVVMRNPPFSLQSPWWLFTFTEYSLLLIPCLGAPWLVREKGHVFVEIALMYLGARGRRVALRLIAIVCVAICLILAWYGIEVTWRDFAEARQDTRAVDVPRWMVVVWIPLAFLFMAIEFARFLWRGENFLGLTIDSTGTSSPER
jgi:TRAP-type C4-dicarboxylate transport system permease small subunit